MQTQTQKCNKSDVVLCGAVHTCAARKSEADCIHMHTGMYGVVAFICFEATVVSQLIMPFCLRHYAR